MTKTSHALENKYKEEAKKAKEEPQDTNLEKLPNPTGWRLLSNALCSVKEETRRWNYYSTRSIKPSTCSNAMLVTY
jgi:hypothetical protein